MKDDSSSMAMEKGLTLRKGGYWDYQRRIPKDLIHHYNNQTKVKHYLGTVTRSEANAKAASFNAYYTNEWDKKRELYQKRALRPQQQATQISPSVIPELAMAAYSRAVGLDELLRHEGAILTPEVRALAFQRGEDGLAHEVDPREEAIEASKVAAAHGDYSGFREAALRLLSAAGYALDPEDKAIALLCRELARLNIKYINTQKARESGEFVDSPELTLEQAKLLTGKNKRVHALESQEQGEELLLGVMIDHWIDQRAISERTRDKGYRACRALYAVMTDKYELLDKKKSIEHGEPWRKVKPSMVSPQHVVQMRDFLLTKMASLTVENLLSALRAAYTKAVRDKKVVSNPTTGVIVEHPKFQPKIDRPFTDTELAVIFATPIFTQQERSRGCAGEAGFWLPLIALFTGARLEELGGLLADDIKQIEGYWSFNIDVNELRRVKSEGSRRTIPIHPKLIELGLLDYRQAIVENRARELAPRAKQGKHRQTDKGYAILFPELPDRKKLGDAKQITASFSKWFNRYLDDVAQIDQKGKNFHSFRHTLVTRLRSCTTDALRRAITGHESGSVEDGYGSTLMKDKYDAICKLEFNSIDWPLIKGRHSNG